MVVFWICCIVISIFGGCFLDLLHSYRIFGGCFLDLLYGYRIFGGCFLDLLSVGSSFCLFCPSCILPHHRKLLIILIEILYMSDRCLFFSDIDV